MKASDEHLEWLEEFLLPSFEIGDSAAMARQIVVVEDTTLFEAIANQVGSRSTAPFYACRVGATRAVPDWSSMRSSKSPTGCRIQRGPTARSRSSPLLSTGVFVCR